MKSTILLLKFLSAVYFTGFFVMFVVVLSDAVVGIWRLNYTETRHDRAIKERLICIAAWPFIVASRKGRRLFVSVTRNIF